MNYSTIIKSDLVNGTGVRVSLFVSGCSHGCKECFNEKAWDYRYGNPFTEKEKNVIMEELSKDYISGISLLGGDPLMPKNISTIIELCKDIKLKYPNKTIWCWSGYTLEEIQQNHAYEILNYIDVLIDGKYVHELRDTTLKFRGSSNQRILIKDKNF